jgi:integrase
MTKENPTLEPSFADAIMAIRTATDPSAQTQRHWCSSLAGIARAFDQPMELIPARFSAVRARMAALHHVPLGWRSKTLSNHRSNAKAALLWYANDVGILPHGVALLPAWETLCAPLRDPSTRYRLLPFARFCSGVGVEPAAVDEAVVDRFMDHRARATTRASDAASRRILARLWNAQIDRIERWPQIRLAEPPVKATAGPSWEDFPAGLRQDVEAHLAGLALVRRNKAGQRIKGCKPATITTRRREIVAAVRMAVREGISLDSITSLKALVHPDAAENILDGYWRKDGEVPKGYTINLASRFVALARWTGGMDEEALRRLEDMRFALEEHRDEGMTEKNLALIRRVLTDGVWARVVNLPERLMQEARLQRRHAPIRAGVLAQIAVTVAILTFVPIRLGNLASIRLGENLTKPSGPESDYWLTFRKYDVKNNVSLQFKLDDIATAIIDEYVHDFRPALTRGSNTDWLFPGQTGGHKEKISFSTQIVGRIYKATGLRITVHQFRHAAGALILRRRPGEYQLVRRILGHKSVTTTLKFYLELETTQASEIFTDIVRHKLDFSRASA